MHADDWFSKIRSHISKLYSTQATHCTWLIFILCYYGNDNVTYV